MTAYFNVLSNSIKRKTRTKEEYIYIANKYLEKGKLTEEEYNSIIVLIEETFSE